MCDFRQTFKGDIHEYRQGKIQIIKKYMGAGDTAQY
jgi:hypothetical protein